MPERRPPLVPRMHAHRATIFGEMSALAAELGAVNLGQGFPDTDGPREVREAARAAITLGHGNQYPPAHGVPALRQAIAAHQKRFYGLSPDWRTEVVVATGASEAIVATVLALVDAGDEVVMFEPYFDLHSAAVSLAGGRRVTVGFRSDDFRPDLVALAAAVTDRTRLLVLNSPHNPTGVVLTGPELAEVARLAVSHDLLVLADEAYEHIWFDGSPHVPLATLPGMWERTVTIGSGGKSFSLTGWKVGWATGPADLIDAVRVVRQHLSYVSGGPFQWAIAEALGLPDAYYEGLRRGFQSARDHLADGLTRLGMPVLPSQGSYFLLGDVQELGFADGYQFCQRAAHEAGVVAIPLQALCDEPEVGTRYVRWAFCKSPSVLDDALGRLGDWLR